MYPQPFGIQTEYNFGSGPQFNSQTKTIESRSLKGGKKHELDARRYLVRSEESGVEWQPNPFVEWIAEFVHGDRTFEDYRNPNNRQRGRLLQLQLQLNY